MEINIPYVPNGTHPIQTGRYLIGTNEIARMQKLVTHWINNRSPGAIIYGRPRLGKTRAVKYLINSLKHSWAFDLPIFSMGCNQHKIPNEGVFFEEMLDSFGHGLPYSGTPSKKRNRLTNFLIEKADLSGQNKVVLFLDDAQRLVEMEYNWLMDINNALDKYGVSMTAILVGQPELIHQRGAFRTAKKTQIIGRFMVHDYQFQGIKTIDDIKACLTGYDSSSEYPEGSGWSFTRYFFPEAYEEGMRLESCADVIYEEITRIRREAGINNEMETPMQYLTLAIEYILKNFGTTGHELKWVERAHWNEAIYESGYIESELYQEVI